MGFAKNQMIEDEERGWSGIDDKYVCSDCIEDEYLQRKVSEAACSPTCDYCGESSEEDIAAPVEIVQSLVSGALYYRFSNPTSAGVPYDGGWVIPGKSTEDVLYLIGLKCDDELYSDIVGALHNDYWVPTAEGHWATSHPNEVYSQSWCSFSDWVKYESRFFFRESSYKDGFRDPQEIPPSHILSMVARLVSSAELVQTRPAGEMLYRVRERKDGERWGIEAGNLGAPPSEDAQAGRMNPAGISYCYLALEQRTAIAEVVRDVPARVVIGTFRTSRDIRVLDLTALPPLPSVFDMERQELREALLFLTKFIAAICEPIDKDGREHIEYVPSQVMSEFFALRFQDGKRRGLDGILYPSSIVGGRNLVLFPTQRGIDRKFEILDFQSGRARLINGSGSG
jgi:RES domain-containing protein